MAHLVLNEMRITFNHLRHLSTFKEDYLDFRRLLNLFKANTLRVDYADNKMLEFKIPTKLK